MQQAAPVYENSLLSLLSSWPGLQRDPDELHGRLPQKSRELCYTLTGWPDLPGKAKTAKLLGALSMMTNRGVTALWFARQLGWTPGDAREFLEELVLSGEAVRARTPL